MDIENTSTPEMMEFKLACKSEEFSDDQIESLFLNFCLGSEKEIHEIVDILRRFRPKVHKSFNDKIASK